MVVFEKEYSDEGMIDLPEDIGDVGGFQNIHLIPKDEYGFMSGTFKVTVTWDPDSDE